MSADVNQLMTFFYPFAAQLVTGPAMLIASITLLWFQIKCAGAGRGRGGWRLHSSLPVGRCVVPAMPWWRCIPPPQPAPDASWHRAPRTATRRWATFVGLGILLVTTPITSIFMKKIVGYRREMLKYTDQVGSGGREAGRRVAGGGQASGLGPGIPKRTPLQGVGQVARSNTFIHTTSRPPSPAPTCSA